MKNCCGVEPMIKTTYIKVEGDNSPETATKVLHVPVLTCPNPNCAEYGKEYDGDAVELYNGGIL